MSYENTTWGKHRTASLPALNNRYRLTKLRDFLGVTHLSGKTLDIGAENFIGTSLGITDNTTGDLNYELNAPSPLYDTICAFEVCAHLYNQGTFIFNIWRKLSPNGRFYLSTPLRWCISSIHGVGNYAEPTESAIRELLELKGFKIIRSKKYRSYPLRFILFGIRPVWKALTHWYIVFECEKI